MKTAYCLRARVDDSSEGDEPEYFRTRKARDAAASLIRIIGGFRTHSYEEKVDADKFESIEFA